MSRSSINLDIANRIPLQPIAEVAWEKLQLDPSQIELFGRYKAKIPLASLPTISEQTGEQAYFGDRHESDDGWRRKDDDAHRSGGWIE